MIRLNEELVKVLQKEIESVDAALAGLGKEEEEVKRETAERLRIFSEDRSRLQARRRHLQALLAFEGVGQAEMEDVPGVPGGAGSAETEEGTVTLADQVYYYLLERGQEQHYREITEALILRGVEITGKDPGLNLVAHIHADERFKRPRRGVYGLAEWYPKRMRSAGSRRRKARRTRVQKAVSGSEK